MNPVSAEQANIIHNVKVAGTNVVVDAVAGSGKSTTILSLAKAMPKHKIIQITYNSMLRCEIKQKVEELQLDNLDVHTYHSLAVKYYFGSAYTDTGIRHIMKLDLPPRIHIPRKHIIVVDEAQDMTPLYFQLVSKYAKDMGHPFQLVVLGDFMQGLYDFKGADTRFLTMAADIWASHPGLKTTKFTHCSLQTSYRITDQMAAFVNDAMLGEARLKSCREGDHAVHYFRNSRRNLENLVVFHIRKLLADGAHPGDFFILGASVKGPNSQIRKLENTLVNYGIPCHVPMFESDIVDEKVVQRKLVFSTFHSVKGRQRKYAFVLGFDQGYMDFYGRLLPQTQCPSTLYVATTRATAGLFILERDEYVSDRPLQFLKMDHFTMKQQDYIEFKGLALLPGAVPNRQPESGDNGNIKKHYVTPTDLIKFVQESVLEAITPTLTEIFVTIFPPGVDLEIQSVIETADGFFEEVSDLNGMAIPAMYYDYLENKWDPGATNVLYNTILLMLDELKDGEHEYLREIASRLPTTFSEPCDYLFLANVYIAIHEKLYFKLRQIGQTDYKWIPASMMEKCKNRLEKQIGKECEDSKPLIEKVIIHQSQEMEHESIDQVLGEYFDESVRFRFTARTDIITAKTLWEIKCVREITMDHKLQVVIYAWLYQILNKEKAIAVRIFNINTNNVLELKASFEQLNYIVVSLLQGKYQESVAKTDEEFLASCMHQSCANPNLNIEQENISIQNI
jgi:hypothetical protein